jgi:hypothetical protein
MLSAPEALSGLLNLALDALPRLRSQGFTEPASVAAALDEYRSVSDPFRVWLDQNVLDDPKGHIEKRELIDRYNKDCSAARRPPMTATGIGLALRRARPGVTDCQITASGKRVDAYKGIDWDCSGVWNA